MFLEKQALIQEDFVVRCLYCEDDLNQKMPLPKRQVQIEVYVVAWSKAYLQPKTCLLKNFKGKRIPYILINQQQVLQFETSYDSRLIKSLGNEHPSYLHRNNGDSLATSGRYN